MRKRILVIFALSLCVLAACGKKKVTQVVQPKSQTPVNAPIPEKKIEIKYRYGGEAYRDPFLPLTERKIMSPSLTSTGEGKMPNFGSLTLKGVISDKNTKIALIASPMGRYVLKNEQLYDSMNRIVKGVRGTIGEGKIKLITQDNFVCELKFESEAQ